MATILTDLKLAIPSLKISGTSATIFVVFPIILRQPILHNIRSIAYYILMVMTAILYPIILTSQVPPSQFTILCMSNLSRYLYVQFL